VDRAGAPVDDGPSEPAEPRGHLAGGDGARERDVEGRLERDGPGGEERAEGSVARGSEHDGGARLRGGEHKGGDQQRGTPRAVPMRPRRLPCRAPSGHQVFSSPGGGTESGADPGVFRSPSAFFTRTRERTSGDAPSRESFGMKRTSVFTSNESVVSTRATS